MRRRAEPGRVEARARHGGSALRPSLALAAVLLSGPVPGAWGAEAAPARCGAGGFVLPGTAACLRLGGVARAEAGVASRAAPLVPAAPVAGGRRAAAALRVGSRVDLDARIPTDSGPIRAYLSVGTGGLGRR